MAKYDTIKAAIEAVIKTNGTGAITGAVMQAALLNMINTLGEGYQFMGVASTGTEPSVTDVPVFYIGGSGTYSYFDQPTVPVGSIVIFMYSGTAWSHQTLDIASWMTTYGYQFVGLKSSTWMPIAQPNIKAFVIGTPGTYTYLANLVVPDGSLLISLWNGSDWTHNVIDIASWVTAANKLYYNGQSGATVNKTITAEGFTLKAGGWIKIKFSARNTADNPTLNINGTGGHNIFYNGEPVDAVNSWDDGDTVAFFYDPSGEGIWQGWNISKNYICQCLGLLEKDVNLISGTAQSLYFYGDFAAGDKVRFIFSGTAGINIGSIQIRNDANVILASTSINADPVDITLGSNTSYLRVVIAGSNITASGTLHTKMLSGIAATTELNADDIEALKAGLALLDNRINEITGYSSEQSLTAGVSASFDIYGNFVAGDKIILSSSGTATIVSDNIIIYDDEHNFVAKLSQDTEKTVTLAHDTEYLHIAISSANVTGSGSLKIDVKTGIAATTEFNSNDIEALKAGFILLDNRINDITGYSSEQSLTAGVSASFDIYGNFAAGDEIILSASGTASIVSDNIVVYDDEHNLVTKLSQDTEKTVTLAHDTEYLRIAISSANVTGSGSLKIDVKTGTAALVESDHNTILEMEETIDGMGRVLSDITGIYSSEESLTAGVSASFDVYGNFAAGDEIILSASGTASIVSDNIVIYDDEHNFVTKLSQNTEKTVTLAHDTEYLHIAVSSANVTGSGSLKIEAKTVGLEGEVENNTEDIRKLENRITESKHPLQFVQGLSGATIEGTPGQRGAVYTIPLESGGVYCMSFDFKFPKDVQQNTGTVQLVKFDHLTNSNCVGGFIIDILKALPTARAPFAQPLYNAGLNFYPVSNKTNNYGTRLRPDGINNKEFIGEDAFTVRFLGDVSQAANQDIVLSIDNTGLLIKHSTNNSTIWRENFPQDGLMNTFISNLLQATAQGGAQYGVFEVKFNLAEGYQTDDLLRVSDIPMVGDYSSQYVSKGWQAFPVFLNYFDDDWHTIEVRYNANMNNSREALTVLYDGLEISNPTQSPSVSGDGVFSANLIIGGEGILVRNFDYRKYETQLKTPKIVVCMTHAQSDGVYDPNVADGHITLGRMQWILDIFAKYGFEFVGLRDINKYFATKDPSLLPNRCYTVIFDDMYYFEDWDDELASKFRQLLASRNAKASFAIAPYAIDTAEKREAIKRDSGIFEFHYHDSTDLSDQFGYEEFMQHYSQLFKTIAQAIGSSNIFTYVSGKCDINVIKLMKQLGISYSSIVNKPVIRFIKADGSGYNTRLSNTCVSLGNVRLAQPRLSIDDDVAESTITAYLNYLQTI